MTTVTNGNHRSHHSRALTVQNVIVDVERCDLRSVHGDVDAFVTLLSPFLHGQRRGGADTEPALVGRGGDVPERGHAEYTPVEGYRPQHREVRGRAPV